jgi:hypothetical protein
VVEDRFASLRCTRAMTWGVLMCRLDARVAAMLVYTAMGCGYSALPQISDDDGGIDGQGDVSIDPAMCDGTMCCSVCGDVRLDIALNEVCDDGNTSACGSCSAYCT